MFVSKYRLISGQPDGHLSMFMVFVSHTWRTNRWKSKLDYQNKKKMLNVNGWPENQYHFISIFVFLEMRRSNFKENKYFFYTDMRSKLNKNTENEIKKIYNFKKVVFFLLFFGWHFDWIIQNNIVKQTRSTLKIWKFFFRHQGKEFIIIIIILSTSNIINMKDHHHWEKINK